MPTAVIERSTKRKIEEAQHIAATSQDPAEIREALRRLEELRSQRRSQAHARTNQGLARSTYVHRNGRHWVGPDGHVSPSRRTLRRNKGRMDPIGQRLGDSYRSNHQARNSINQTDGNEAHVQDGSNGLQLAVGTPKLTIKSQIKGLRKVLAAQVLAARGQTGNPIREVTQVHVPQRTRR